MALARRKIWFVALAAKKTSPDVCAAVMPDSEPAAGMLPPENLWTTGSVTFAESPAVQLLPLPGPNAP